MSEMFLFGETSSMTSSMVTIRNGFQWGNKDLPGIGAVWNILEMLSNFV